MAIREDRQLDPDVRRMLCFQNGDQRAFRELFEIHRKPVINFCFRFCRNRTLAEDLAQEVFLRVYRGAGGYRPDARFTTWLYRIAVNVCLNETRKARYHVRVESIDRPGLEGMDDMPREVSDDCLPNPGEMVASKQRDAAIERAMTRLPEQQRIALVLRTHHGFSYDEIASQMSCSEGKVKTLIFRARQRLKEMLKEYL
ncbi:MAG: sigma-70 family RNA polymerase sigma factor [Desulfobacteraceae bacterium]|nr:sigma-70 family RNA polymerase sigma factor [Desulfobacteraceae bacterium]